MPAISTKAVRRRILIVEDEAPIRELLRLHLSLAGFDIEEVAEGTAALERTRAEKFDVLLTPQAKQVELMPLGTAIRIKGSFRHADVSIDKGKAGSAPALDSPACIASASRR